MATSSRAAFRWAAQTKPLSPSFRLTATHHAPRTLPHQAFQTTSRRAYADGGPQTRRSKTSVALYGIAFSTTIAVAGYATYYATQNQGAWDKSKDNAKAESKSTAPKPEVKPEGKPEAQTSASSYAPKKEEYQKVYNAIAKRLDEKDDYDDGSYGPVLVRLAWHCSGTYDKDTNTGGSNGATMRFAPEGDHGANAGLKAARDFLEPVKTAFPWITYSDLWTLAGVCAIQEMQGPAIPWRPGRSDRDVSMCTPDGRLPDGAKEQSHLRAIFGRMGFDDREIVALSGAHALGRCHTDRSGFEGPWSFSPTVMSNDYYRLLMDEKWGWRKWNGPKQYEDKSTKTLMMLPTDMALIEDPVFQKHVERFAKDDQVFFKEFRDVIVKLLELGVPFMSKEEDRMTLDPLEE